MTVCLSYILVGFLEKGTGKAGRDVIYFLVLFFRSCVEKRRKITTFSTLRLVFLQRSRKEEKQSE